MSRVDHPMAIFGHLELTDFCQRRWMRETLVILFIGIASLVTAARAEAADILAGDQSLAAEQSIVSRNGKYRARMQGDGNFVVYDGIDVLGTIWGDVPQQGLAATGAACHDSRDCASGSCVDNVCCSSACTETCMACNVAGRLGTCSPVPAAQQDLATCASRGVACNGAGRCLTKPLYPCQTGSQCSTGICKNITTPCNRDGVQYLNPCGMVCFYNQ